MSVYLWKHIFSEFFWVVPWRIVAAYNVLPSKAATHFFGIFPNDLGEMASGCRKLWFVVIIVFNFFVPQVCGLRGMFPVAIPRGNVFTCTEPAFSATMFRRSSPVGKCSCIFLSLLGKTCVVLERRNLMLRSVAIMSVELNLIHVVRLTIFRVHLTIVTFNIVKIRFYNNTTYLSK